MPQKKADDMDNIIKRIIELEWDMFQNVRNHGGRADCQDDHDTFFIMRTAQFDNWSMEVLQSYFTDLIQGKKEGRNLVSEKYAYMMRDTNPSEFYEIEHMVPAVSQQKKELIDQIVNVNMRWKTKVDQKYPMVSKQGRISYSKDEIQGMTSVETYLRGELSTYSMTTLEKYWKYMENLEVQDKNLAEMILDNTAKIYGYRDIADAEAKYCKREERAGERKQR